MPEEGRTKKKHRQKDKKTRKMDHPTGSVQEAEPPGEGNGHQCQEGKRCAHRNANGLRNPTACLFLVWHQSEREKKQQRGEGKQEDNWEQKLEEGGGRLPGSEGARNGNTACPGKRKNRPWREELAPARGAYFRQVPCKRRGEDSSRKKKSVN